MNLFLLHYEKAHLQPGTMNRFVFKHVAVNSPIINVTLAWVRGSKSEGNEIRGGYLSTSRHTVFEPSLQCATSKEEKNVYFCELWIDCSIIIIFFL